MKLCKNLLVILLSCICLFGAFSVPAAAARATASSRMICTGSGYKRNKTTMYGQTYAEKCITLEKNKTVKVNPYTITNNSFGQKRYVRFTVWIYDINTGRRVDNETCSNNGYTSYKNTTGKTQYLSVQVRPYVSTTAWRYYSYDSINAYIKSSQYRFICNY